MIKIKCPHCGKTLFLTDGKVIEIKCCRAGCKKIIKVELKTVERKAHGSVRE